MARIAILTDQLYNIGGINSLICLKSNYWVRVKNYEVCIITTENQKSGSFYELDSKIEHYDLDINYDRSKSYFSYPNIFKVFSNYFRLKKILRKLQPDFIIIANHIPVTFFFPLLFSRSKIIKEYHFSKFYRSKLKPSLSRRVEAYIESMLDYQLVLNPEEKDFYSSQTAVCIPNPILLEDNYVPTFQHRAKTAIAAGRISQVKRFDVLIEIWSKFIEYDKEWTLEIYGDGDPNITKDLMRLIEKHHLENRVFLKNPRNDLMEVMKKKGLYLMTSEQECFPMVLLEAQATGLPILAMDCPTGPRNIINNKENGLLVPFDDQDAFVKALLLLTADEEYRTNLAVRSFNDVQQFSLQNIMEIWDSKIINVLK